MFRYLYYVYMPPKKRNPSKNQPTLNQYIDKQEHTELKPADRQAKIDYLIGRLVNVRSQIEQKNREEARLLNSILRLKIAEVPKNNLNMLSVDEQYWIMTTQDMLTKNNVGMFNFLLSEYGETVPSKNNKQICQETNTSVASLAIQQRQWKDRGSLKPQYLNNYTHDFINSLKQYQYVADQMKDHQ